METKLAHLFCIENIALVIEDLLVDYLPEPKMFVFYRRYIKSRHEVLRRLPDGIRYNKNELVLFKFNADSQPVDDDFEEAWFYHHKCQDKYRRFCQTVQTVVIISQRLNHQTKAQFGYDNSSYPGVHTSQNPNLAKILLISLDELSLEHHNAWFKCFAHTKAERKKAYEVLQQNHIRLIPTSLKPLLAELAAQEDVQ